MNRGIPTTLRALALALGLVVVVASCQNEPTSAESEVPPPTASAIADDFDSEANDAAHAEATERTRERMEAVATEMREIADLYGPDAVILQTKLLIQCGKVGARAPTEVRIVGPHPPSSGTHMEVEVATGILLDADRVLATDRASLIWRAVASPVLASMTSFNMEPAGLSLTLLYGVQDLESADGVRIDPMEPSEPGSLKVTIDAEALVALANRDLEIDEVVSEADVRVGARRLKDWLRPRE